jgi:tRNA1Val (adenine37-N6)-methyltransferase
MSNNYFSFKQFTVYQDQCAMKVGTDGVLLGSWTDVKKASRILDVGTGTGLIAIMLAQRSPALIDGVEIEKNACLQARKNATGSPWHKRIKLYHDSIQHYSETKSSSYDVIVSNPPFFQNSLKPSVRSKTIAKHDVGLNYSTLLSCSAKLLKPGGRLSFIIPAVGQREFISRADFHRLQPSRLTWVRPAPGKEFSRCLIEFTGMTGISCSENELIIRKSDLKTYAEEYIELTRDFYLGF